jgi:hypothetical protein
MTPLQTFAQTLTETRKVFDTSRDTTAWSVFYEAKQMAYAKLVAALPKVKGIEDFWRYVQSMAPAAWLPRIEKEILRVTYRKHLCRNCGTATITLPQRCRVCLSCQKASRTARNERYQKSLKHDSLRRVQPNFVREEISTITRNHITRQPLQTVDSERVLTAGAVS